ncbi:metallophosphoesterase family protein [Sedimentisphaera salicampi]|uniref:Cyclic 3',5'-adenosine monophosphate phosphodiesterase n=1 Tax=Sedimentisphaera salicampi TaxID=1941349 RepID=A0A1W6LJ00_9BACT|nr:metallophosphoesterase [Sedimentisphaera salicampi]ARN55770.1 cyclic 3',5'-adenosine monophosphate phosphodiesterase [Sedimentisphaera salicampi]
MKRRDFLKSIGAAELGLGLAPSLFAAHADFSESCEVNFQKMKNCGDKFSFAIFADPQVGTMNSNSRVAKNARRFQIESVKEINSFSPKPQFALFLGDLVNVPNDASFKNFVDCIKHCEPEVLLVHGNHDTRPPYTKYKEMQKRVNGMQRTYYSYDVGSWHFIVTPCNLNGASEIEIETEKNMLSWLEADLEKNKNRPTIFFNHLPLMPIGLSQLEWYVFRLEIRKKMVDLITKHGNVKYFFNGHVHNGIKASVKTSWEYKGTKFVNVPTIIEGRNFGEEYDRYEHGLPTGGYYMMVHVDGEDVSLEGRLTGVEKGYHYPNDFKEFSEDIEPRWFTKAIDLKPNTKLVNGSFEEGLKGWYQTYRYISDKDPMFKTEVKSDISTAGKKSVYVHTIPKGRIFWANDDNNSIYQMVSSPGDSPILKAKYFTKERPANAGGFIRFNAVAEDGFKFLMMFHWGSNQYRADYLPRCIGYEIHGKQQNWAFLQQIALKNQGFFWKISDDPDKWHTLQVNIPDLYDKAVSKQGAYSKLGISKFYIQLGAWTNRELDSGSVVRFDDVELFSKENVKSKVDNENLAVSEWVHLTEFGQRLINRTGVPELNRLK